jgi:acyl-CoA dehydrogenase
MPGLDADVLEMMLQAIQEFAERHLPTELLLRLDHEDHCPEELVRRMCGDELGVHLIFVPEEYGGMGGASFDVCRVCEKLAGIDLGVATSVLATALGSDPISVGATEEQKKRWLTRIAEEGLLFAYGATEPEAGSDLGALRTTATPITEDGRTTGSKVASSGSAMVGSPTPTRSWPTRPAGRAGSLSSAEPTASPRPSPRTSTASG